MANTFALDQAELIFRSLDDGRRSLALLLDIAVSADDLEDRLSAEETLARLGFAIVPTATAEVFKRFRRSPSSVSQEELSAALYAVNSGPCGRGWQGTDSDE